MQHRCSATKANGAQCGAAAYQGGAYCWFHDPATAADRQRGRHLGGAAKSNRARARKQLETTAMTPAELEGIIGLTIKAVLAEQKAPAIGNAIAALARAAITIRQATEIEQRLSELERSLGIGERSA